MNKSLELKKLEKELITLAQQDQKTWVSFYKLMREVRDRELYRQTSNNYTQWVKNFSLKCGIHESSLWNRLKAGKIYESYQRVQEQKGLKPKALEEINVTVDSLVLLDKISKKSEDLGAELVEKVLNKELTRADLRETYKALGGDTRKATKQKLQEAEEIEEAEEELAREDRVNAANIVNTLSNHVWLNVTVNNKRFVRSEQMQKYKAYTEFSVQTGTTRKSRRIDVLAVENLTSEEWGIRLHGIEIKVTKSDLISDEKYMEYAQSVDFLWLAIPLELLEFALKTKADIVGIIVVQDNKANIHTQATKLNPLARENTLTNIILKTI